jgi:hypothetical protein
VTQPIAPGTPAVTAAIPVAARAGNVYLTSPITGEVREVDPQAAAEMIQAGWVPPGETSAEAVRAEQIPREVAAQQSGLGKFGYGVARGVMTPLVDLALPQGSRVHEVLSDDSPWLVGGGEAAGMLGSVLLGAGPAAALEQGSAKVAAGLGAGNGIVRTAFGRAAQGGLEGAAYGVMGAVSEAHQQNVPLTAQRLGSEVLPGLLFGSVLGGGLGAVEGGLMRFAGKAGTLPERLASVEKSKLDEIFKAGVADEDALRLAQRELGVKDPGALERFQAIASGGDVSPERLALLKDPGPVGQRARADAFGSGVERLAEAERQVLDKGNDYLLGREEAMRQVMGDVKAKHIAEMIGPGEAGADDIGKLVRDHIKPPPDYDRALAAAQQVDAPALAQYSDSAIGVNGNLWNAARRPGVRLREEAVAIKNALQSEMAQIRAAGGAYDGTVYRGVKATDDELKYFLDGNELDIPAFQSSSANRDVALKYMNLERAAKYRNPVEFVIHQSDGVPIPNHVTPEAREILLEPGRFRVLNKTQENGIWRIELEQIGSAVAESPRVGFVNRVLDRIDEKVVAQLKRSLGATDDNLPARIAAGLARGDSEVVNALQSALWSSKISDDALREFGTQGAWAQRPLGFFEKWKGQLEGLAALPKGVNDNAGDIKKLLGNLEYAEQAVMREPRRVAAAELDTLKKRIADFADAGERLGAGSGVPAAARAMYEDLRQILEDPIVWGPKFAGFQSRVNQLLHQNIGVAGEFDNLFVKTIGKPDPENPWRSARVVDSEKVSKALSEMSEPKQLEQLNRLREHLDDQKKFFQEILGSTKPGPKSHVRIQAAIKQVDQLREAIDSAVYLNTAQRQGRALLGYGPLGTGRAVVGAVLGGPLGAAAGMAVSAALNPGKMLQFRAIAERMAESSGSRVWRGISRLLGLQVGDVARGAAGFIGKTAGRGHRAPGKVGAIVGAMLNQRGDERARTYSQTIKQLVEARQRLPELAQHVDEIMPTLEQALPGTKAQMLAQAQRGLDYVLSHLPAQPRLRVYGETSAPLNDHDYEQFVRMAIAATDPPSILEMAEDGELTPDAVAAAEYAAPELVEYVRSEAVRAIQDVGADAVPYANRISASLLLRTALDESLEPENIAIQQATHQKRRELDAERREELSGGSGGETGVNQRYTQSESDRLESGVPPR